MKYKLLSTIFLLIIAFIWGFTFFIVGQAITIVQPFTFNTIRFLIASIALIIVQSFLNRDKQTKSKNKVGFIYPGIILGFFLFIGLSFQTFSLATTSRSNLGIISLLSILFVPLLLFFKENKKQNTLSIITLLIAIIGLIIQLLTNKFTFNITNILTIICAISFSFHIIFSKKFTATFDILSLTTVQVVSVCLFSWTFALIFENWQVVFNHNLWSNKLFMASVLFTAFFSTGIAFFIQMYAQKYITPTKVAIILSTQTIFSTLTDHYFDGRHLTKYILISCFLLFISILLSEINLTKKDRKKEITTHIM
ncbi:DMT family transporter [Bacillus sp. RG28]|uniref:DMT family transporter n=1 Tax=Gottfriedia endophytica TaxID=2820819 RepID=A0A940SFM6_9BACI|nr:DMT family transporter [Gottfriedia endophytica]MBP0724157.1 DMT family transporter [Gottfriedia endophytica]